MSESATTGPGPAPSAPPPELAPVRPGEDLDWDALSAYLRAHLDGVAGPPEVLQFPLGAANLTYLVRFGSTHLVVRRPPFGTIAAGAHDMEREFRALSRLSPHYRKAPRALLHCSDRGVIGSEFVVIEYRSGVVIRQAIPEAMAGLPDVAARIGGAVVDALAELHLLDPVACGLDDLGRGHGYLDRQVTGWRRRWEAVAPHPPNRTMDEVGERLRASMPATARTTVIHNDFKLDNCQFDPDDPDQVKSVFDWDMATLGDPLADLGTLLNYWPDPSDTPDDRPMLHPGMEGFGLPTRQEVVARYAERTGASVDAVPWYEAFACWKTAVLLQQLHDRYVRGETADERMSSIANALPVQVHRALRILDEAGRG